MIRDRLRTLPVATRMLITAGMLVLIVLPAAGSILSWNFREAVGTAFDERLESLLNVVLASVSYDAREDRLVTNRQLGDPRFDRVFSGWYWQVRDDSTRALTSRSLWDQRLAVTREQGVVRSTIDGPGGESLRMIERDIRLPNLNDVLHVSVAADLSEIDAEVSRFQQLLWLSLITLGLLLLVLIWLQIRWGLEPLRRIEKSLKGVEQGRFKYLDTHLPRELERLAMAINTVLARDQKMIERGRTAAGNLAHALKTPVSVLGMLTERLPTEQQPGFQKELRRLDEAVRHHLARASAAGPVMLGGDQDLQSVLAPLVKGIQSLSSRRGIALDVVYGNPGRVQAELQDIQEMVGNLLENAVNWADSRVRLSCDLTDSGVVIAVEDDGPGMSDEDCDRALSRGTRLDEERSGSGLGLAIVNDLVGLYEGTITLGRSILGGLRVTLTLPAN